MDNLLTQIILPKITFEVDEWNPLTDTVPIHTWIHPWLPLMSEYPHHTLFINQSRHLYLHFSFHLTESKMDTLIYPTIRRKLSSALTTWHPSDRSARLMLQPWSQVFAKGDMDAFMLKNIIPKLQIALSELVINPHQQHLDHWNWVHDWKDLIPTHTMAAILDKYFFPKWLQVLGLWLNSNPNYEQVTDWYTGWKGMLSDKLLIEPVIKGNILFNISLIRRSLVHGFR